MKLYWQSLGVFDKYDFLDITRRDLFISLSSVAFMSGDHHVIGRTSTLRPTETFNFQSLSTGEVDAWVYNSDGTDEAPKIKSLDARHCPVFTPHPRHHRNTY